MDKEYKCKQCCRCHYYYAYYTKGNFKFNKVKIGFCSKKQREVDNHGTCDCWSLESELINSIRKKKSLNKLHELLEQISEIRQILEEAKEDEV